MAIRNDFVSKFTAMTRSNLAGQCLKKLLKRTFSVVFKNMNILVNYLKHKQRYLKVLLGKKSLIVIENMYNMKNTLNKLGLSCAKLSTA